jgi:hypothetical protein
MTKRTTPNSFVDELDKLEQKIKGRYGEDALVFSFDKLDHDIAKALSYRQYGKEWLLPTIEDDCTCKWTKVSEDRACGNHSPVLHRVRQIKKALQNYALQSRIEGLEDVKQDIYDNTEVFETALALGIIDRHIADLKKQKGESDG